MELENFKELWNREEHNLPEISLEKQDEIHSPLEMIRINMKTEFWLMIVTLPAILIGFPFATQDFNVKMIAVFVTVLTLGLVVYFYSRFLKLYKMLSKTSINTNYDLFNIRTQLLVSKEIYICYYISYIPLAFVSSLEQINFKFNLDYHIAIFGITFLIAVLLLCVIIRYWIYYMYGKYINDVVRLVDELNGVELIPEKTRKITWFERSQKFFMTRFGIRGNILNTVIWFILAYLFIIIFFSLTIAGIIILGAKFGWIDLQVLLKALDRSDS